MLEERPKDDCLYGEHLTLLYVSDNYGLVFKEELDILTKRFPTRFFDLHLKMFFDNNLDFYKYYRTNITYMDDKYFIRSNYDIKYTLDSYYFESDSRFSTSNDFKVAKILANDLIQVYIENELLNLNKHIGIANSDIGKMRYHGREVKQPQLIDLIYALQSYAVFNMGKADIKAIATYFENVFEINLGDFYHTYLEIRNRKNKQNQVS